MSETREELLEMREQLLRAITNVQMKLKSLEDPSAKLCYACDTSCTACAGSCTACASTKVI